MNNSSHKNEVVLTEFSIRDIDIVKKINKPPARIWADSITYPIGML